MTIEQVKDGVLAPKAFEVLRHVETFDKPAGVTSVSLVCSEVTAVCPVTGQPDFYSITIIYKPVEACVESKSLKLYLASFRDRGIFCEGLAAEIAGEVLMSAEPDWVLVKVVQTPRGGIAITGQTTLTWKKWLDQGRKLV